MTATRWLAWPLIAGVRLYQVTLRPLMAGHCRFSPSCSEYAIEALRTLGPIRGTRLAVGRILRCRPGGGGGYDPVPIPDTHSKYEQNTSQDNSDVVR